MPEDSDKLPDPKDKTPEGKDDGAGQQPVRTWSKRIYGALGAVAVVGGVLGFGTQVEHWFTGLSQASDATCGISASSQIERSPNLGISFHQGNQLALMSYVNSTNSREVPTIDVCLTSAPFEIWFPALTGPESDVEVCTSFTTWPFHYNPAKFGSNGPGCLVPIATDAADNLYASGTLFVSTPFTNPIHTDISGTRAAPASGGQEKYFVSTLHYEPHLNTLRAIPMSEQTANLYIVIFTTQDWRATIGTDSRGLTTLKFSYSQIEHFVLRFK